MAPEPQGLPDPFGDVWPELVEREANVCECCCMCDRCTSPRYCKGEPDADNGWRGDDWDEWIRCLEDERERPWEHYAREAREDRTPDSQRYLDWPNYNDWRRAFPNLQWDAA